MNSFTTRKKNTTTGIYLRKQIENEICKYIIEIISLSSLKTSSEILLKNWILNIKESYNIKFTIKKI